MLRSITYTFLVAGILAALVVPAQAATDHVVKVKATTTASTTRLPGSGADLALDSVRVGGKLIAFGEQSGNVTSMYGRGVAVRFTQHGSTHYVRVVSVSDKASTVSVRFHYNTKWDPAPDVQPNQ